MAYQTYTTRAVVCGSKDSYTSDRSYLLFTEDAGMLWASARSVRAEQSKQRYALQDFSLIRVSLVKGRSGWRVGSVEAITNPFLAARSRSDRALITNLVRLLRRYVHGEEPVRPVFADLVELMEQCTSLPDEIVRSVQPVFTVRLLHTLGYVVRSTTLEPLLDAPSSLSATPSLDEHRLRLAQQAIEAAETVSHL